MAEVILEDTASYTAYTDSGEGWSSYRVVWKPGTPPHTREGIETRVRQALVSNATFQALATPTNAQLIAQVRSLTRQCNGLIRLRLGALDDASDS